MLGAIAGDIIGSIYEGNPIKTPGVDAIAQQALARLDQSLRKVTQAFMSEYLSLGMKAIRIDAVDRFHQSIAPAPLSRA